MSYTLYNRPGSGGFVVEAALTLAETPFQLIELDSKAGTTLPDSFRETNPWGQLPTLILPDGSTMTETAAMLIHIAAAFPEKNLAPPPGTPAHAAFLRWTVFAGINVYEARPRCWAPGSRPSPRPWHRQHSPSASASGPAALPAGRCRPSASSAEARCVLPHSASGRALDVSAWSAGGSAMDQCLPRPCQRLVICSVVPSGPNAS